MPDAGSTSLGLPSVQNHDLNKFLLGINLQSILFCYAGKNKNKIKTELNSVNWESTEMEECERRTKGNIQKVFAYLPQYGCV